MVFSSVSKGAPTKIRKHVRYTIIGWVVVEYKSDRPPLNRFQSLNIFLHIRWPNDWCIVQNDITVGGCEGIPPQTCNTATLGPTLQQQQLEGDWGAPPQEGCGVNDHQKTSLWTRQDLPKKDGSYWPVFNLQSLNWFMYNSHFKMEGLPVIKEKENWWIWKWPISFFCPHGRKDPLSSLQTADPLVTGCINTAYESSWRCRTFWYKSALLRYHGE